MNISIRKFLLINLLLAIAATTSLTTIGNYYLDQRDIEHHLDTLLSQSTLTIAALVDDDLKNRNIKKLQANIDNIPKIAEKDFARWLDRYSPYSYEDDYQFQIWSDTGELMLRSPYAPSLPFSSGNIGFKDKSIDGSNWRVFTTYNPSAGLIYAVAERFDTRDKLAHRIALDDLYIMLLTFPLSGLLIWIIIGQGLGSLKRVTNEVAHRDPQYLESVGIQNVPIEIKPLVDELNKLLFRLQQALEREKRFSADAAHELRTPLAALKTQTQVALGVKSEEERKKTFSNILNCVDRCTHVVQQLLTLSRLVPETTTLEDSSPLNLARLTVDIIAQIALQAVEKKIEIELIKDNDSLIIYGNVTALSILIRNVVDNAIRYTPRKGSVKVYVLDVGNTIQLKVIDSGPGIPAELRSRVFERFFRVVGSKVSGSGLGLSIVQQIAKLHNADLTLGSAPDGTGLDITIIFPKPTAEQLDPD